MTAPAPAATSGAEDPVPQQALRPRTFPRLRSSAAAIGVPNIAPIVPANARPAQARVGTPGEDPQADGHGEAEVQAR